MNDTSQITPEQRLEDLVASLQKFVDEGCEILQQYKEVTMIVPCDKWKEIAYQLRDDKAFCFEQLIDVCGVDYSTYGQAEWETTGASVTGFGRGVTEVKVDDSDQATRFASVYHLLSMSKNVRLRVRVFVDSEHPIVDSMIDVWSVADWFERESFDLMGIMYDGHPDLRRILTDYGFVGHPFRKDFPLEGHVEMRYDEEQGRVIYQPVTIVHRTQVPRVIRNDHRHVSDSTQMKEDNNA